MLYSKCTFVAKIINQNNFCQVFSWCSLDDTVDCPHECGPPFIMEDDDNAGGEQVVVIMPVFAPTKRVAFVSFHTVIYRTA